MCESEVDSARNNPTTVRRSAYLLPEDGLGLTTETLLFTIVTTTTLGSLSFLGLLVLRHLVHAVNLALFAVRTALLRYVYLQRTEERGTVDHKPIIIGAQHNLRIPHTHKSVPVNIVSNSSLERPFHRTPSFRALAEWLAWPLHSNCTFNNAQRGKNIAKFSHHVPFWMFSSIQSQTKRGSTEQAVNVSRPATDDRTPVSGIDNLKENSKYEMNIQASERR